MSPTLLSEVRDHIFLSVHSFPNPLFLSINPQLSNQIRIKSTIPDRIFSYIIIWFDPWPQFGFPPHSNLGIGLIFLPTILQNVQLICSLTWMLYRTVPDWNTWRVFFIATLDDAHSNGEWLFRNMNAIGRSLLALILEYLMVPVFCQVLGRKILITLEFNITRITSNKWLLIIQ